MSPYLKIFVRGLLGAGLAGSALMTQAVAAAPAGGEVKVVWMAVTAAAVSAFFTTVYAGWAALDDAPTGMTQVPTTSLVNASPPVAMDDRPYLRCWVPVLVAAAALGLVACAAPPPPQEAFSRACATVGEAMVQVNQQRRAGVIDAATFVAVDDAYDVAVATCATLPPDASSSAAALAKINEFLARAGSATGANYSY